MEFFLKFFIDGGAFMWPILGVQILSLAFMLERYLTLTMNYGVKNSFFSRVKNMVKDGKIQEAYHYCMTTSHPLSKVISVILYNANSKQDVIESASNIEIQKVLPGIQKRTNYINMMANVATLLGLLGTIQGLIVSFTSIAGASPSEKSKILAAGISTAMNTTAYGLVVAIPCIIVFAILTSMEDSILKKYDLIISEVKHLIVNKVSDKEVVNEDTAFREFKEFKKYGS